MSIRLEVDSPRWAHLQAKLEDIAKSRPSVIRIMREDSRTALNELKVVPPQPSRTRAKTFNTYVRGIGQYPRSAFGSTRMRPGAHQGRYGRIRYTSEKLTSKWKVEISDADEATVTLYNNASYAVWVQDEQKQRRFHKVTGWIVLQPVAKRMHSNIAKDMQQLYKNLVGNE